MALNPLSVLSVASQCSITSSECPAQGDASEHNCVRSRPPAAPDASGREVSPAASTVLRKTARQAGLTAELASRLLSGTSTTGAGSISGEHQCLLDEFTEKWTRGEVRDVETYLAHIAAPSPSITIELIYREYCLAELSGAQPDAASILKRFPQHRTLLERLFSVHRECSASELDNWLGPAAVEAVLPEVGDEIGPYLLRRELGRGSFARVFLAEQCDLENRLVILKLSTTPTREPWLLARARHAHIVEILSHAMVDDGAFQLICMPFLGGATLSAVLEGRRANPRPRRARGDLLADLDAVAAPEYASVNPSRPAREILGRLTDPQALAWITARLADALDHAARPRRDPRRRQAVEHPAHRRWQPDAPGLQPGTELVSCED